MLGAPAPQPVPRRVTWPSHVMWLKARQTGTVLGTADTGSRGGPRGQRLPRAGQGRARHHPPASVS